MFPGIYFPFPSFLYQATPHSQRATKPRVGTATRSNMLQTADLRTWVTTTLHVYYYTLIITCSILRQKIGVTWQVKWRLQKEILHTLILTILILTKSEFMYQIRLLICKFNRNNGIKVADCRIRLSPKPCNVFLGPICSRIGHPSWNYLLTNWENSCLKKILATR